MFKNLKIENFTYSRVPRFYLENLNKKCRKSQKNQKINSEIQKFVGVSGPNKIAQKLKTHKKIPRIYLENPLKNVDKLKIVIFTDSSVPRFYLGNLNKKCRKSF